MMSFVQKRLFESDHLEYLRGRQTLEKDVVGIVTFDQSHYCLYQNCIPEFVTKRSMLTSK